MDSQITNLIRVGGLLIALNEAFFGTSPHDPLPFGIAAFMMAGAQALDSLFPAVFGGKK